MDLNFDKDTELIAFNQWKTYDFLLEGIPTLQMNDMIMVRLKKKAKELFNIGAFYLFVPEQKLIDFPKEYKFGTPARLPDVTCIAKFYYKDKALVVAWYQDDFTFNTEPEFLEKIKAIPWEEVSGESDWG
jgi:hypothetical protein